MSNPHQLGLHQPAEWLPHSACWLAFPSHEEWWFEDLAEAQAEFIALAKVIARSEKLEILVLNPEIEAIASHALQGLPVRFHSLPFGDIWMRDTAPIFVTPKIPNSTTKSGVLLFDWNGWGNKYLMPNDDGVSRAIAKYLGSKTFAFPLVLEGGAIEVDGAGTCLTTRQCMLNPNRNPQLNEADTSAYLKAAFGVDQVLWIDEGLLNDHTDGHIDTIARFIAPGKVMCMSETSNGDRDPNARVLQQIAEQLATFSDAQGRKLEVITIPSPGLVEDKHGEIMPASYLNFYIANGDVIVPTYGTEFDQMALEAIAAHFPTRRTVGLPGKTILVGGGAFHCITQQQPLEANPISLLN